MILGLVLGAQVGDVFLIGQRRICVASIEGTVRFMLTRIDRKLFAVGYDRITEVFPGVFVYIGSKRGRASPSLVPGAVGVAIGRDSGHPL